MVEAPPLRHRTDDVLPLAHAFALHDRRRTVGVTPRAARSLTGYTWPGNVRQLRRVVREAVSRADVVDVQHLAPEVLDSGSRTLTRLERLERDEIVRCLTEPGTTVTRAAEELGIGRAHAVPEDRPIQDHAAALDGLTWWGDGGPAGRGARRRPRFTA